MRFLVAVICILGTVQAGIITEEQKARIIQLNKQCMDEVKADEALVMKAKIGDYVDDPKLKKHLLCFAKKAGFQNEAGDLQMDVIKAKVNAITNDEKLTNDYISKCAIKKNTPEDTTFETLKCFHKLAPEKDILGS